MSTRTRVVLSYGEGCFYGSRAIRELAYKTGTTERFNSKLGDTKAERLMRVAEKLPKGWTLILIQEPRRMRKNRSTYWQTRNLKSPARII